MNEFEDPRLTAIGLLAEVHTGLVERLRPALSDSGLTLVDHETLIRLARSPGQSLRMSDLAAQTDMSTSGITRVVDRLEREHLVVRRACDTDRRASYATLTDAGRARLKEVLPQHLADIEANFTGLLSEDQLDTFLSLLRIIRGVVRPCATAGAEAAPGVEAIPEEAVYGAEKTAADLT